MKINRLHVDIPLLAVGHTIQLVGAIYQGPNGSYRVPFPGEDIDLEMEEISMTPDEFAEFLNQTDVLDIEGPEKAILRKSQRQIDQIVSWRVFKRDGYRCRYCGNNDAPLTVDHIVPYEVGGATVETNLVSSCRKCNRIKGSHTNWLATHEYQSRSVGISAADHKRNVEQFAAAQKLPRVKPRSR